MCYVLLNIVLALHVIKTYEPSSVLGHIRVLCLTVDKISTEQGPVGVSRPFSSGRSILVSS